MVSKRFMLPSTSPLILLASLLLGGCSWLPEIEPVPVQTPESLPEAAHSRPVVLDRVILDVPNGTVVGEQRSGYACFPSSAQPHKWIGGVQVARDGEYHREFERILREYNYQLMDRPASLFERPKYSGEELVVAAKITSIKENRCTAIDGFNRNQGEYLGNVRFSVHWEVYSLRDQRVVVSFDNEASAQFEEFVQSGGPSYYVTAFGNALKGLLANSEFRKAVTSSPATT